MPGTQADWDPVFSSLTSQKDTQECEQVNTYKANVDCRKGQEGVKQGTAVGRLPSGGQGRQEVRADLRSESQGAEPQILDSTATWGARAQGTEQAESGTRVRPGLLPGRSHRAEPICRVKFAVCPSVPPGKWGDSGSLKASVSLWELSVGGEPPLLGSAPPAPHLVERPVLQHPPPHPPPQPPFLIFTQAYLILT